MKAHKLLIILTFLVFNTLAFSQVTLSGTAYLQNQTAHGGIKVIFERSTPSFLKDSTYTDNSGQYSKNMPIGVYNVYYSKTNYVSNQNINQIITSNTNLPNVTLNLHISLINVPGDFTSIQEAINNSFAGDTIVVQPGTYNENLQISKSIILTSNYFYSNNTSQINSTIINGSQLSDVIQITNSCPKIIGLTITNGLGRGIKSISSSPYLKNLIVSSNNGTNSGGGGAMFFDGGSPIIENTTLKNNTACFGGAIYTIGTNVMMRNVILSENSANNNCGFGGIGGAIYLGNGGISNFQNVVFDNNSSVNNGSVIYVNHGSNFTLTNSIVSNNIGNFAIYIASGTCDIYHSNFWNNGISICYGCNPFVGVNNTTNANSDSCDFFNNIQFNPMFETNGNIYQPQLNSKCINAGNNATVATNHDFLDNQRIWNGNVDMGVFEINAPLNTIPNNLFPNISTNAISAITETTAISGGSITNFGGSEILSYGICYSTFLNPTISDNVIESAEGVASFTCSIMDLSPDVTYYVRAFATTCFGTSYGQQNTFSTTSLDVRNFSSKNGITIYPNPTSKNLFVKSSTRLAGDKYSILDQTGRQVLQGILNNEIPIDVNALTNGFYLINIDGEQFLSAKFIKQ